MFEETQKILNDLPLDTKDAIGLLINVLSEHLYPALNILNEKLIESSDDGTVSQISGNESLRSIADVDLFSLCNNQIFKCSNILVDIFKKESQNSCILEESRSWVLDRMTWCLEKLDGLVLGNEIGIKSTLPLLGNHGSKNVDKDLANVDICCGDNFISRVDNALDLMDIFSKLFSADCAANNKLNEEIYEHGKWEDECCHQLFGLHSVVRELIFAAMSICQNCLSIDQKIVNARCQVVLRESKQFIYEIMYDTTFSKDDSATVNINKIKLKENVNYAHVRLFNDILKDAIYNLEASINRAVLGLVLVCLVNPTETLLKLTDERKGYKNILHEDKKDMLAETEIKSALIKDFDILNERLIQIGLFAISCSSDKLRVSMLRSCLASLEALEPYLVPSLLSSSNNLHSQILIDHWIKEVSALRTLVFLIVDPVAFIEIVMEQYQTKLNDFKKEEILQWSSAQSFIELGNSILDYIKAYLEHEPKAISGHETLTLLSADLKKVIKECRAVSNLFLLTQRLDSSDSTSVKSSSTKEQKNNGGRVVKRFKLMYTILTRISKEIIGEKSIIDDEDMPENENEDNKEIIDNATWVRPKVNSENKSVQKSEHSKGVFKFFHKIMNINSEKHVSKMDITYINNDIKKDCLDMPKHYSVNNTFSRSTITRKVRKSQRQRYAEKNKLSVFNEIKHEITVPNVCFNEYVSASNCHIYDSNEEFFLANISMDGDDKMNKNFECIDITGIQFGSILSSGRDQTRRRSFFYGDKLKSRHFRDLSLRKRLLINQTETNNILSNKTDSHYGKSTNVSTFVTSSTSLQSKRDNLNSTFDLHVTEILEQLTGLSDTISLMKIDCIDEVPKSYPLKYNPPSKMDNCKNESRNILTLKINEEEIPPPKNVWNIKIQSDKENIPVTPTFLESDKNGSTIHQSICSVNCDIDVSFGSNIQTPERLNDLHQLEQKLADLKSFWNK